MGNCDLLPLGNLVWGHFPYQQDQNHIQLEVQAGPPRELLKLKTIPLISSTE